MSSYSHNVDTLEHHPQDAVSSPTRAYFPASKTTSISPALSASLSDKLAATLVSKKAYDSLPSIQKVITGHNSKKADEADAPDYDETIANIPVLDLLPPPPVYDIVNCSTTQTLLLVSSLINTILAVNDRLACPKITLFHSRAIPNISIEAYLSRILQYAPFQNEVLLIILLYFDRIGGGCKPTQVLTNTIPKALLRQASLTPKDINQLTAPKADNGEDDGRRRDEKDELTARFCQEMSAADQEGPDNMDEDEPIADEIYTSSSESPVGSKLIINSFNIHRLLITSILVASKFSSDVFYPNVRYARVGGLPLSELNQLELEFLFLSQFELNTSESELQTYGNKLLMYHQRLNGIERAASDAITPAKGEYVRLSEKKHIVHDGKAVPSSRIQSSVQSPQHRPSSESESRAFVSSGPYRDSKEIIDEDDIMSEKADDNIGSPTDWKSCQITPVIKSETATTKYATQRSNKMNLNHMIWPTNEMDTEYTPSSYYGAMVKDEDAARIEEEFNKASPPPESSEPNPKRKLQRLSSGTLEAAPAKRVNTPSKSITSSPDAKSTGQPVSGNKNILRPLLRKIASFASNRSEAPVQEPEPQPPAPRSHPYLVRHHVSPASSNTNLAGLDEMETPTSPTSHSGSWQQDNYTSPTQGHTRAPPAFQMKPPPPPYSGQGQGHEHDRQRSPPMNQAAAYKVAVQGTSLRLQHRSREPSLSSLASELTFEPARSNLSPMCEEPSHDSGSASHSHQHPATLAPFYFPPKPQSIEVPRNVQHHYSPPHTHDSHQGYSTPPATPMNRKDNSSSDASQSLREHHPFEFPSSSSSAQQTTANLSSEADDNAMQCDEQPISSPISTSSTRHFHSEPLVVSDYTTGVSSGQGKYKMKESERIETEGLDAGASSSFSSPSPSSSSAAPSSFAVNGRRGTAENETTTAGRHWIPRHAPAPTHPPVQYPHPHYVASYHPAPAVQLLQGPSVAVAATTVGPRPGLVVIPRNPQALAPSLATTSSSNISGRNKQPLAPLVPPPPVTASRPTRQFAPIRPRTPMTMDDDSKDRAALLTIEPSSSGSKKKRTTSSERVQHQQPLSLRPLVPTMLAGTAHGGTGAAPPPYRPPFIAYPSPYHPHLRGPDGNPVRPPPPTPMLMAVDYPHGAIAAGGHAPQFIAAAGPSGPRLHPGGGVPKTTRLYIPMIPVMYNNPPQQLVPATPLMPPNGSGKFPGKTNTPAKIAPRLHRP